MYQEPIEVASPGEMTYICFRISILLTQGNDFLHCPGPGPCQGHDLALSGITPAVYDQLLSQDSSTPKPHVRVYACFELWCHCVGNDSKLQHAGLYSIAATLQPTLVLVAQQLTGQRHLGNVTCSVSPAS